IDLFRKQFAGQRVLQALETPSFVYEGSTSVRLYDLSSPRPIGTPPDVIVENFRDRRRSVPPAEGDARTPASRAPPAAAVATAPTFLTRADLTFVWARFVTSDPRFAWDAQVEVDIDVLDTRKWRMNFDAHYD